MMFLWTISTAALAGRALLGVEDPTNPALAPAAKAMGVELLRCHDAPRICVVEVPEAWADLSPLSTLPGVRFVEEDVRLEAPILAPIPRTLYGDAGGTTDCAELWDLSALRATTVWDQVTGLSAAPIAIADSGFLASHEDLDGQIFAQYDYGDGDSLAEVSWTAGVPGHGTFIAGLISAVPDNDAGRAGLAPDAQLVLHKIADSSGALYISYAVDSMAALAEGSLGVRVLSYSLASSPRSESLGEAVAALGEAGILLVAAAGNCGSPGCSDANNDAFPLYPAGEAGDHILSVAGSTPSDTLNPYSHYGAESVDLAAPGVDLCSLDVGGNDDYAVASGTSYATPLVAAAAGLLWEAHPDLAAGDVAEILRASAKPSADLADKVRAGGRLDVVEALAAPWTTLEGSALDTGAALTLTNLAAEADQRVLLHCEAPGATLTATGPADLTSAEYGPGETIDLPDGTSFDVTGRALLTRFTLAAHSAASVVIAASAPGGAPCEALAFATGGERVVTGMDSFTFDAEAKAEIDGPKTEEKGTCATAEAGGSVAWLGLIFALLRRRRQA
ncbi:MAG: S8 family serine peptidase [Deltaproteobacteria bacterium]|nr:S8 family serine peptidase [Deltaproteobacteria bacterium]